MGSKMSISNPKGKSEYNDLEAFANDSSYGGAATGFGSAAFGIPFMKDGGKSFNVGAQGPQATGPGSFCQGICTKASGMGAMATGESSESSGEASFTAGKSTKSTANFAAAFGDGSQSTAEGAFAAGKDVKATAPAAVALGQGVTANQGGQVVVGGPAGTPFKVSNGSDLFTVSNEGTGEFKKDLNVTEAGNFGKSVVIGQTLTVKSSGRFSGAVTAPGFVVGGGDYAEFFQWEDHNLNLEDRRFRFVTLEENRIRLANDFDDWILGIVSVNPSVLGDASADKMLNPEWAKVGLLGKLILEDDGTCVPNRWCTSNMDGIGTRTDYQTRFRVMKRLDKDHVQVLIL